MVESVQRETLVKEPPKKSSIKNQHVPIGELENNTRFFSYVPFFIAQRFELSTKNNTVIQ